MSTPVSGQTLEPTAALSRLAGLWSYRELLWRLVLRNLQVKFKRSLLGFAWTLFNPLITVGVLGLVFSYVVRIPLENYWAFLLTGFFVWNFVIQTLNTGTYVFEEHSRLLRGVAFPSELLVFGAVLSKLIEFFAEMLLVLGVVIFFHHGEVPAALAMLPLLIVIQLALATGLTLPVAALSVFYSDVRHALPIALMTLFYASPVFYPASLVPEEFRWLYMLNPFAGLLTLYQDCVYRGVFPSLGLVLGVSAVSFAIAALGYAIFRRHAPIYAELV